MKRPDVDVVTLGCSKNLVDSERLLALFANNGITARHNPDESARPARTVVINTCGFIGDAKEQSIETILSYCLLKGAGTVERVVVMGCLSERYRKELPVEIPEVDAWYGKYDWQGVVNMLVDEVKPVAESDRTITTGTYTAYVKISEGCNRGCAFCAIPIITGRHKSRTIEDIEAEVTKLAASGVTEINVIAQDLSSYGLDIYGEHRLAQLLERLAAIDGIRWIRLHYAYPADFPYDILPLMRDNPKICRYLDIALQHASDTVLTNMRRHITAAQTRELLDRIRREVPGIHLRTTLMTGFPGEGEKEFDELLDFVREQRFERMGAFAYCEEDDTYAARNYTDDIPQEVKQQRLDRLMALQEEISLEHQTAKVGQTLTVLIDREEDDYYVGRTEFDSPEVDPEVLVKKTRRLKPGQYVEVTVKEALPFELIAEL